MQPYVLLVPYNSQFWNGSDFNGDAGQAYLEQVYADTFNDEAHFIFAYLACANDSKDTLIVMIVRTSAQRKREKEEYTRQILETPLEKFGTDTSELEKKYQDQ